MSYQALARRWRPKSFEEVVAQEHITISLKNALLNDRITHAYLFAGPRGTGKTTTARILAKAINCKKEERKLRPCNECSFCEAINSGNCLDVLEIDGASNRGIDEIRELRERIKFAPILLKYKVYIIDEVHMLTEAAFNALLKTLEEPPPYVVFIFATTDPHKVPLTILSRCQRYDFKRISPKNITMALEKILKEEEISLDKETINQISYAATGSLRDAQTLLEQLISFKGKNITKEDVLFLLARVSLKDMIDLSEAISKNDKEKSLNIIKTLYYQGIDLEEFSLDLLRFFKDLYLLKISPSMEEVLELGKEEIEEMKSQLPNYEAEYLKNIIEYLKKLPSNLKESDHPKLILELAVLDLIELKNKIPISLIYEKILELEEEYQKKEKIISFKEEDYQSLKEEEFSTSSLEIIPSLSLEEIRRGWKKLLERIKKRKASLSSFLREGEIVGVENQHIILGFQEGFSFSMVDKKENREIIEEEIRNTFNQELKIRIALQKKNEIKREEAKELNYNFILESEPVVRDVLEVFGGQIIKVSK
jgi:DNA polymerase-3 subunit gamma/tau